MCTCNCESRLETDIEGILKTVCDWKKCKVPFWVKEYTFSDSKHTFCIPCLTEIYEKRDLYIKYDPSLSKEDAMKKILESLIDL